MKHTKSRFKGINGLFADYFWYSINHKKDKKRGVQELEIWYANILPKLDGEEPLIRLSFIEILYYKYLVKSIQKWNLLEISNKITIISIFINVLIDSECSLIFLVIRLLGC